MQKVKSFYLTKEVRGFYWCLRSQNKNKNPRILPKKFQFFNVTNFIESLK